MEEKETKIDETQAEIEACQEIAEDTHTDDNDEEIEVSEATAQIIEDEGINVNVKITSETFNEFYNQGGIFDSIKQTLILCLIMCLIIYIFRDKEKGIGSLLTSMGIYCGIIIAVSLIMKVITKKVIIPKQYTKYGLDKADIELHITNAALTQIVECQQARLPWENVSMVRETPHSFMLYGFNKRAVIFSKDTLTPQDIDYIHNVASSRVSKFLNK